MVTAEAPALRERAIARTLPIIGVTLTPEFTAALAPRPREKLVTGGWQAGKSTEAAAEVWVDLPSCDPDRPEPYRYWIIMPAYNTPAKELEYLHDWAVARGICDAYHVSDNDASRLVLMGGRIIIETRSAQHPERIAAEAVDGIVVVEAGQMPESIRVQCQGRVMTRRGWITYTGTIEDDEAKPRWAWFGQRAEEWIGASTEEYAAFALPSWANVSAFPEGRNDPEIRRQYEVLGEHAFNRRIAGRPSGVQYPVYPALAHRGYADKWGLPPNVVWVRSLGAGGHDYGETYGHLTALAALTVTDRDVAWVREVRCNQSGDMRWLETQRRDLSGKYGISLYRWGADPMQREAAELMDATVLKSRQLKVGMVEARLTDNRLMFDLEGPGVEEAFRQMQRVHYIKREVAGMGFRYEYARVDDDMAAAIEDAVGVIDGGSGLSLPLSLELGRPRPATGLQTFRSRRKVKTGWRVPRA